MSCPASLDSFPCYPSFSALPPPHTSLLLLSGSRHPVATSSCRAVCRALDVTLFPFYFYRCTFVPRCSGVAFPFLSGCVAYILSWFLGLACHFRRCMLYHTVPNQHYCIFIFTFSRFFFSDGWCLRIRRVSSQPHVISQISHCAYRPWLYVLLTDHPRQSSTILVFTQFTLIPMADVELIRSLLRPHPDFPQKVSSGC